MRKPSMQVIVLVLIGCTTAQKVNRTDTRGVALDPNGTAYVSTPENGRFDQTVYGQSGRQMARAVGGAFSTCLKWT